MNPICEKDINSLECQMWMSKVCEHCRSLFSREAADTWAAWWHDKTPVVYKEVQEMTVYDCNKLKHLLEVEVSALVPDSIVARPRVPNFEWWQKVVLILFYIGFIVICLIVTCCCKKVCIRHNKPADKELEAPPLAESQPPVETTPIVNEQKKKTKEKQTIQVWMRNKCRRIFVHNEGAVRRQQLKYREKEQLREALTRENIEKWTRARERIKKKRREKATHLDNDKPKTEHTKDNESERKPL